MSLCQKKVMSSLLYAW